MPESAAALPPFTAADVALLAAILVLYLRPRNLGGKESSDEQQSNVLNYLPEVCS